MAAFCSNYRLQLPNYTIPQSHTSMLLNLTDSSWRRHRPGSHRTGRSRTAGCGRWLRASSSASTQAHWRGGADSGERSTARRHHTGVPVFVGGAARGGGESGVRSQSRAICGLRLGCCAAAGIGRLRQPAAGGVLSRAGGLFSAAGGGRARDRHHDRARIARRSLLRPAAVDRRRAGCARCG